MNMFRVEEGDEDAVKALRNRDRRLLTTPYEYGVLTEKITSRIYSPIQYLGLGLRSHAASTGPVVTP